MIHAKWCPDCKIVWQTRRVTCPGCRRRFDEDAAFTISKGRATWRDAQAVGEAADSHQPADTDGEGT